MDLKALKSGDSVLLEVLRDGTHKRIQDGSSSNTIVGSEWFEVVAILDHPTKDYFQIVVAVQDPLILSWRLGEAAFLHDLKTSIGGPRFSMSRKDADRQCWLVHEDVVLNVRPGKSALVRQVTPVACCSNCGEPNTYGMVNGPGGSFTCYPCRQDPWTRRALKAP